MSGMKTRKPHWSMFLKPNEERAQGTGSSLNAASRSNKISTENWPLGFFFFLAQLCTKCSYEGSEVIVLDKFGQDVNLFRACWPTLWS